MGGFIKGADAIEEQEKADHEARKAAYSSDRLEYLQIKADDTVFLRFLTEGSDLIKVAQHNFVKTKPAPSDAKNWPKSMSAVCRKDVQIRGILDLGENDCYICSAKVHSAFRPEFVRPTSKVWALAVLRKQVKGDGSPEQGGPDKKGKVLGFDDVREDYKLRDADGKPTEETRQRPKIVLVNMSWGNFFAALGHNHQMRGTMCDRDYAVKRSGEGTDTDYSVMALDPVPGLAPGTDQWKRYTDQLAEREITLEQTVINMASDLWYARWFDPTKTVDKDDKIVPVVPGGTGESYSPPSESSGGSDEAEQSKLAELRERLSQGAS
jgi:hypothetical protein